jgi:hypothetical protein
MFALENVQTRHSLRAVFENIFSKYGRHFDEDDEIDLLSLEVTKPGGHLARIQPLKFGRAYRGKEAPLESLSGDEIPDPNETFEDVFEVERKRMTPGDDGHAAQLQSSFIKAVASTKGPEEEHRSKSRPKTFNHVLKGIYRAERRIRRRFRSPHPKSNCLDCILMRIIQS